MGQARRGRCPRVRAVPHRGLRLRRRFGYVHGVPPHERRDEIHACYDGHRAGVGGRRRYVRGCRRRPLSQGARRHPLPRLTGWAGKLPRASSPRRDFRAARPRVHGRGGEGSRYGVQVRRISAIALESCVRWTCGSMRRGSGGAHSRRHDDEGGESCGDDPASDLSDGLFDVLVAKLTTQHG